MQLLAKFKKILHMGLRATLNFRKFKVALNPMERIFLNFAKSCISFLTNELRGTDNVQGQISEHIFAPNGGYCVYYPSNLFRNACSFENWEIFSDIPQF